MTGSKRTVATLAAVLVLAFIWPQQPAEGETEAPLGATQAQEAYIGTFGQETIAEVLASHGVKLHPEDRASAFPDPAFGLGTTVTVQRAPVVSLSVDGSLVPVPTWSATVGELLDSYGLALGEKDIVLPPRDRVVRDGLIVQVTRVAEAEVSEVRSVAFSTREQSDGSLTVGTRKEVQAGALGRDRLVYQVRREDGVEVSRQLVRTERVLEPVERVVAVGTKKLSRAVSSVAPGWSEDGEASWYAIGGRHCNQGRFTAAHKTLPRGTQVRVTDLDTGKSVTVTIDDRGPYKEGRIIDLSCDAFAQLAPTGKGVLQRVRITVL